MDDLISLFTQNLHELLILLFDVKSDSSLLPFHASFSQILQGNAFLSQILHSYAFSHDTVSFLRLALTLTTFSISLDQDDYPKICSCINKCQKFHIQSLRTIFLKSIISTYLCFFSFLSNFFHDHQVHLFR